MNCKRCGSPLGEGATICAVCGESVETQAVNPVENSNVQPAVSTPNIENVVDVSAPVVNDLNNNSGVTNITPVQATENVIQPVNTNVAEQPTNVTPTPTQPVSNVAAPQAPFQPKKKNDIIFFIICGVLVVAIIVLVILILNNNNSNKPSNDPKTTAAANNNDPKTSSTSSSSNTTLPRSTVDTTSGSYTEYYGVKIYVPETFVVQNQDGNLTFTSNTKRQMLVLQVQDYEYDDLASDFDNYVKELESGGFVSTTKSSTEYKGMKYSVVRGNLSGVDLSTGYAKFAEGYTVMFAFRTDYATENEYLETLLQIISNSNSTSSFNKNSAENNVSTFIKDSSKLNIE